MQYALLIYVTEATEAIPEEVMVAQREGYNAFSRHLRDRGAMLGGEALQPTASATTVRVVDGRTVTTDAIVLPITSSQVSSIRNACMPLLRRLFCKNWLMASCKEISPMTQKYAICCANICCPDFIDFHRLVY